jgi:deoxyadenosine/deoxycytidine kinase
MRKRPIVIAVEGIIGTGKTTLISECLEPLLTERGYKVKIIVEPVHLWKEILPLFYNDPKRWAYHFQTTTFITRVQESIKMWNEFHDTTDIFITERSILSDTFFVETLHRQENFTDLEYKDYYNWWNLWETIMPFTPDLYVYLTPSMDEIMKRVKIRARPGEESVCVEYQTLLREQHDKVLNHDFVGPCSVVGRWTDSVPVLKIDTDLNFKDDITVKQDIVNQLEEKIHEITYIPPRNTIIKDANFWLVITPLFCVFIVLFTGLLFGQY